MNVRGIFILIVSLWLVVRPYTATGQDPTTQTSASVAGAPRYTVDVEDLSPKFLDFYRAATETHSDPEQRWALWKQKYDFAAVPPIAAGQKIARDRLDEAWSKYPNILGRIQHGAAGLTPPPQPLLEQVADLLAATRSVHLKLIAFVGTFHREAFAMGLKDGISTIAIPIEDPDEFHALDMTHEFTHAVEMQQSNWTGQSVASALFTEGLATRVTEHLLPGSPANIYTASTPEWMQQCTAALPAVLADLKAHLGDEGAEAVSRFTFEKGAAGLKREVYCGGWFVIGKLLKDGRTFAQLGNLSRADAERTAKMTIDQMLASTDAAGPTPQI
jgi:Predicted Zn-dependent protease (DUF2268)